MLRSRPRQRQDGQCWLYRIIDVNGELLYVGITYDWKKRLSVHARREWWCDAHTVRMDLYGCRRDARLCETRAIATENPVCNTARPRLYAYIERHRAEPLATVWQDAHA